MSVTSYLRVAMHLAMLGAAALLVFAIAPVSATTTTAKKPVTKTLTYEYGVDSSAWYWVHQIDEEVGAGPISQRQKLPNPQRQDTLPVAYENGDPTKVSALKFDLSGREVPPNSKVTSFRLTIAEDRGKGEPPTVNPNNRVIEACAADEAWSPGEADLWNTKPDAGTCVPGKRKEQKLEDAKGGKAENLAVTWTFDLTALAADWGVDPFKNNGVVFQGAEAKEKGPQETWQVNLKLPQKDASETPNDEYKETVDRVAVKVGYIPGAVKTDTPGGAIDSGAGAGDVPAGGDAPAGDAPPAGDTPGGGPAEGENPQLTAAKPFEPKMPWYVWLLIPGALVASYLLRTMLADAPASGGGRVLDQIRRQNAARRGPLPEPVGPVQKLFGRFTSRRAG